MNTWVVVKTMVPFWIPIIVWHLIFRVPQKGTKILTTTHLRSWVDFLGGLGSRVQGLGFRIRVWGLYKEGKGLGGKWKRRKHAL